MCYRIEIFKAKEKKRESFYLLYLKIKLISSIIFSKLRNILLSNAQLIFLLSFKLFRDWFYWNSFHVLFALSFLYPNIPCKLINQSMNSLLMNLSIEYHNPSSVLLAIREFTSGRNESLSRFDEQIKNQDTSVGVTMSLWRPLTTAVSYRSCSRWLRRNVY